MNNFTPFHHIQIAADNISKLRKVDVYRLFEQTNEANFGLLANYITTERPDLAEEVREILSEASIPSR